MDQNERAIPDIAAVGVSRKGAHKPLGKKRIGSLLTEGAGAVFQSFKTVSLCQAPGLLPALD